MHPLKKILRKFIKDYGLEAGLTLTTIRKQWEKLVGGAIASHTQPEEIKGKTIFITVDTPQWMHHLGFFKQEICEKLKPYKVDEVRFKLGRLSEKDNAVKALGKKAALTEEDFQYIEDTLKCIKDSELKEKFRVLITNALKRGKNQGTSF
jgi:hypothetical protein